MIKLLENKKLEEIARDEFLEFVSAIVAVRTDNEEEHASWVRHFKKIVPHPSKSDLIFWPEEGADDSPKGIVAEIERYCRENGLPGFKDSGF